MDPAVALSTFGVVFVAELGDKTQFAAMALATRHPWRPVFVGLAAAFVLLNATAVLVGQLLFGLVPLAWIRLASAALFLWFGISTLRGSGDEEGAAASADRRGPVASAFLLILLAELGDKTQVVTASLAAQHASRWAVFAGSTAALWSVSLLGLLLGRQLMRMVPLAAVRWAAGLLFLAFGAAMAWQGVALLRGP